MLINQFSNKDSLTQTKCPQHLIVTGLHSVRLGCVYLYRMCITIFVRRVGDSVADVTAVG